MEFLKKRRKKNPNLDKSTIYVFEMFFDTATRNTDNRTE